jgi:nitrogen fixation-related uncharacterized protein
LYDLPATAFLFGMSLLPLALLFVMYALWTFLWRSEKIKTRDVSRYDSDHLRDLCLFSLSPSFIWFSLSFLDVIFNLHPSLYLF